MPKKKQPAQSLAALLANSGSQAKPSPKKPKSKPKRHIVGVGDIVEVHGATISGYVGPVFRIQQVLSEDQVIAKPVAPGLANYRGQPFVLYTYKPRGKDTDGDDLYQWRFYIKSVISRVAPEFEPKSKPKPAKKPPKVLTSPEELIEHLASGEGGKAVYEPLPETKP